DEPDAERHRQGRGVDVGLDIDAGGRQLDKETLGVEAEGEVERERGRERYAGRVAALDALVLGADVVERDAGRPAGLEAQIEVRTCASGARDVGHSHREVGGSDARRQLAKRVK